MAEVFQRIEKKKLFFVIGAICIIVIILFGLTLLNDSQSGNNNSIQQITIANPRVPAYLFTPGEWVQDEKTNIKYIYNEKTGTYELRDSSGRSYFYDPESGVIIAYNEATGEEYIYDLATGELKTIDRNGNVIDTPAHVRRYFEEIVEVASTLPTDLVSGRSFNDKYPTIGSQSQPPNPSLDHDSSASSSNLPKSGSNNVLDLFNPNQRGQSSTSSGEQMFPDDYYKEKTTSGGSSMFIGGSSGSSGNSSNNTRVDYNPPPAPDYSSFMSGLGGGGSTYDSVNNQGGKRDFMEGQRVSNDFAGAGQALGGSTVIEPYSGNIVSRNGNTTYSVASQYQVDVGTVIPVVLQTGVNTDLPGQLIGVATRNVYDSLTGTDIIIPQGTKFFANYSSDISFSQKRVIVAWNYFIRPDGIGMSLPGMPGVDAEGFAGYRDEVNTHFWSKVGGVALATLLNLGNAQLNNLSESEREAALASTNAINSAVGEVISNIMNRQPTLILNSGQTVNIFVNESFSLKPFYF